MSAAPDRETQLLMDVILDAERGWPELEKRNPKLAERFRREQRDVASKVHRTPPRCLDGMVFGRLFRRRSRP